ncbi:hypothetical protein PI124_g12175 [Phytophthora idaei]|nr:hypothetical protein PI124_g12175 [Phytophthora idaei]
MPGLTSTASVSALELGGSKGSWENMKKADGLKDRASTVHDLKYYVEEQKRLYQELPFRVLPGMRRRSFRSEREFPQLRPRSSWANLSRLVQKYGERKPLLEEEEEPGYTYPLLLSCMVAVINAFQYGYNTAVTGTTYQLAMVVGILATDILAFGFAGESQSFTQPGWRLMFGFAGFLGAIQILLTPLLIESPRWLLNSGEEKEAEHTLRRLRQTDDVFDELDSISAVSFSESGDVQGVGQVLRDRNIRLQLMVAVVLQCAQQLSGINAVMFYASSFFLNAGLENPLVGITLVYIVNVLATIVALMLMDSAGRRPLLLWSVVGMLASSGILTVGLLDLLPFASMFSVGGVMSFVWFFEIGLGPIPWLIAAEMFPARSRTAATSIATMVNWLGLFLVGIFFPTMQGALGDFIFVPFAILLGLALAFSLKYVPETKGKTVDEIQNEITGKAQ